MKYFVAAILTGIVLVLASPIMLVRWKTDGWESISNGINEMCGAD
jgi:hypothetical protein